MGKSYSRLYGAGIVYVMSDRRKQIRNENLKRNLCEVIHSFDAGNEFLYRIVLNIASFLRGFHVLFEKVAFGEIEELYVAIEKVVMINWCVVKFAEWIRCF